MAFYKYIGTVGPVAYPTYQLLYVSPNDIIDFGAVTPPNDGQWQASAGPATSAQVPVQPADHPTPPIPSNGAVWTWQGGAAAFRVPTGVDPTAMNPLNRQHVRPNRVNTVTTDITSFANNSTPDATLTKSYAWPTSGMTNGHGRLATAAEIAALPLKLTAGRPNFLFVSPLSYLSSTPTTNNSDSPPQWPYVSQSSYRFMFDGNKLDVTLYAASGLTVDSYMIFVDGQPVSLTASTLTAVADYVHIVFPSAKPRLIEIRTDCLIGPITCGPLYTLWQPSPVAKPRVMVVGASYSAPVVWNGGPGTAAPYQYGIYQQIADYIDVDDFWIDAVAGTGLLTRAASGIGNPNNNYVDRVSGVISTAPDVLIIDTAFANDAYFGNSAAAIASAANGYFNTIRASLPNAKIIVCTGLRAPLYGDFSSVYAATVSALQAMRGDLYYIDTSTFFDAAGGYTPGHTNGLGNTDVYVGADGVHPTVEGCTYWRGRLAPKIQRILTDNGALVGSIL